MLLIPESYQVGHLDFGTTHYKGGPPIFSYVVFFFPLSYYSFFSHRRNFRGRL